MTGMPKRINIAPADLFFDMISPCLDLGLVLSPCFQCALLILDTKVLQELRACKTCEYLILNCKMILKCKTNELHMQNMQIMAHDASSVAKMCKTKERVRRKHQLVPLHLPVGLAQDETDLIAIQWPCVFREVRAVTEDLTRASTHCSHAKCCQVIAAKQHQKQKLTQSITRTVSHRNTRGTTGVRHHGTGILGLPDVVGVRDDPAVCIAATAIVPVLPNAPASPDSAEQCELMRKH